MNKVAALVSAYYAEEYLEGRILNLFEQTLVPQIVIVCQAGSPEEAIAVEALGLGEQEKRYRRGNDAGVVLITPGIPTIYEAWNRAIMGCDAEYLMNANCDDRLAPDYCERMSQELDRRRRAAVVYSDVDVVADLDGGFRLAKRIRKYVWGEGGLDELLTGCFLGPCPVWRRSLHSEYGLFDDSFEASGDYEFWLRLAAGGERFYKVKDYVGAIYLDRPKSAEKRKPWRSIWETARARGLHRPALNLAAMRGV